MSLSGKRVLVTGAAGGVGKALCRCFMDRGARVLAADIDEGALGQLRADLPGIEIVRCDLTDETACAEMFAGKPFDVVVNNAGITHFSRFSDTTPQTIRNVMTVNFFAAVNVTKAVLPALKSSGGSVAAISSVAGFSPLYGRTGYSASKHAMHGFFDSLRSELREDGVHVLIVCPSFIATQQDVRRSKEVSDVARPGSASQTAGRPLSPDMVAEQICQAVVRRRELLVVGRLGKLSYWINRISPRLFEHLMVRRMKSEIDAGS